VIFQIDDRAKCGRVEQVAEQHVGCIAQAGKNGIGTPAIARLLAHVVVPALSRS
jgi:hypothetical protein